MAGCLSGGGLAGETAALAGVRHMERGEKGMNMREMQRHMMERRAGDERIRCEWLRHKNGCVRAFVAAWHLRGARDRPSVRPMRRSETFTF